MKRLLLTMYCFYGILLTSCVKDKPQYANSTFVRLSGDNAFIVNEGNYGNGNATIDVYNLENDTLQKNVYESVNGEPIGDVLQQVVKYEQSFYLLVNNSNKIISIDASTLKKVSEISIPSPRYLLPVRQDILLVSSLYRSKIYVVNPLINSITDSISTPYSNIENITLHDGEIYISSWDTACTSLYIIDINSKKIKDSISINAAAPNHLLSVDGNLWVFYGNVWKGKNSGITIINTQSKSIIAQKNYVGMAEMVKPILSHDKKNIYWLGIDYSIGVSTMNGVFHMKSDALFFPMEAVIKAPEQQYFYGLAQLKDESIWVSNPNSFLTGSKVLNFDIDLKLIKEVQTGIGTNNIIPWE